jgi:hypothetical protein
MSGSSSISPDGRAAFSDHHPRGGGGGGDDGTASSVDDSTTNGSSAAPPMTSTAANSSTPSPSLRTATTTTRSTIIPDSQHQQQQQQQPQISQGHNDEEEDEEEEDLWIVSCRCESAKAVSTLLSCLKHVNDNYTSGSTGGGNHYDGTTRDGRKKSSSSSTTQAINPVSVFCSPTSITFHVYGQAKQTQASVDMQASSLFSEYRTIAAPHQVDDDGQVQPAEEWKAGGEVCSTKI